MYFTRANLLNLGTYVSPLHAWRAAGLVAMVLALIGVAHGQDNNNYNNYNNYGNQAGSNSGGSTPGNPQGDASAAPNQLRQPNNEPSARQDSRARRDARVDKDRERSAKRGFAGNPASSSSMSTAWRSPVNNSDRTATCPFADWVPT